MQYELCYQYVHEGLMTVWRMTISHKLPHVLTTRTLGASVKQFRIKYCNEDLCYLIFKFPLQLVAIFAEGLGVNHGIKIRVPGCTNPYHASTYWSAPGGAVWKNSGYKWLPCWTPDMGWMDTNWCRSTWWLQMPWHLLAPNKYQAISKLVVLYGYKSLPLNSLDLHTSDTNRKL